MTALQVEAASDLGEIGFFAWDLISGQLTLSDQAATIMSRPGGPVHPFGIGDLRRLRIVHMTQHVRAIRRSLRKGDLRMPVSCVLMRHDGDSRQIQVSLRPLWRDGRLEQLAGAVIDQTDRRRSEAELRATMSTVPSAMIVIDASGTIRAFSAAAELMFDRIAAETIGSPIEILMPEPYRTEHAGYLLRYLKTSEARIIGQSRIMTAVRADGTEFPIELWVGDASTETERLFTGFIRDHSVRFETEAKLQMLQNDLLHVARLSTAGELSMALAHELNQPLGALVNHLETAEYLAQSEVIDRDRLLRTIAKASDQSMRAGNIVKRLRTFIEKGEADMRIEPAAAIVDEAASLLSSAIRQKGIGFSVVAEGRQLKILADRVQIQQVLFNLLRNAMEALETPGLAKRRLTVSVRAVPENLVEIAVEDSGPGLDAGIDIGLIPAFSSVKPDGMGVGLSISRRIIEAHGGRLSHRAVPGGGARFAFTLPAVKKGDEHHE